MKGEYRLNYEFLKDFITNENELRTPKGFADFLGITPQAVYKKLNRGTSFTIEQIAKTKKHFNLSDKKVNLYFFNIKF